MAALEGTDEERIEYLRAHGITVDLPGERSSKPEVTDPLPSSVATATFAYVKIPVDENEPYEELSAVLPVDEFGKKPPGDRIPFIVKSMFASRSKGIDEETLRQHATSQLGEAGASVTPHALMSATVDGSVETFVLARPGEVNSHNGVYFYLDEVGVLKDLPPNHRANALAASCGHQGVKFHGDIFVGRVAIRASPPCNLDFTVSDLDSSNDWLKAAPAENYEYNLAMQDMNNALSAQQNVQQVNMGGNGSNGSFPEGSHEGYSWTQTSDDVEICVTIPDGTRAKDVIVAIKSKSVLVKLKTGEASELVNVDLFADIHADDSTWTIGSDGLVITLEKSRPTTWASLEKNNRAALGSELGPQSVMESLGNMRP